MRRYETCGMTHLTAFVDRVMKSREKLNDRMRKLMPDENDRRSFLRHVYINWMLRQPVGKVVSNEARCVYEIAKTKMPDPRINGGMSVKELDDLEHEIMSSVDSVLPLFGKDPENDWFVKLHLYGAQWGFAELISQIAVSELLSDRAVGIDDPMKWRKHWRGGLL